MKLAAVGSNCIDYYNNLDGGKAFPGGGPVNMAVYTVRLGGEAAYIGPVGNDSYGEIMMEAMKKKGVNISHLRVEEGKTAVSQVELVDGERILGDYEEGVLETYVLSDEDMDFIQNFDVVICDVWGKVEGQFKELKERGMWFVCADMGGTTMYDLNLTGSIGLVIGNEGEGVSKLVKENCDMVASIPMKGDIDSLNASVATGVLAYEIVRQRIGKGK